VVTVEVFIFLEKISFNWFMQRVWPEAGVGRVCHRFKPNQPVRPALTETLAP
jgi:hypothetical protein